MNKLTDDQARMLRSIPDSGLYEGAFPLWSNLSEQRCRVVRQQLHRRGLIRPMMSNEGVRTGTWMVTAYGKQALRVLR